MIYTPPFLFHDSTRRLRFGRALASETARAKIPHIYADNGGRYKDCMAVRIRQSAQRRRCTTFGGRSLEAAQGKTRNDKSAAIYGRALGGLQSGWTAAKVRILSLPPNIFFTDCQMRRNC